MLPLMQECVRTHTCSASERASERERQTNHLEERLLDQAQARASYIYWIAESFQPGNYANGPVCAAITAVRAAVCKTKDHF